MVVNLSVENSIYRSTSCHKWVKNTTYGKKSILKGLQNQDSLPKRERDLDMGFETDIYLLEAV